MFMSSIVWSYSKDLLHHAAQKQQPHGREVSRKNIVFVLLVKDKQFGFFHLMYNN